METRKLTLDGKMAKIDNNGHLVISDPAVLAKLKSRGAGGTRAEDPSVEAGITLTIKG